VASPEVPDSQQETLAAPHIQEATLGLAASDTQVPMGIHTQAADSRGANPVAADTLVANP